MNKFLFSSALALFAATVASAQVTYPEGVAELLLLEPLRIENFGEAQHFLRLVGIFDSQEVENRL